MFEGLTAQRLLALFALGWALLNFPLLGLWDRDLTVLGIPLLPAAGLHRLGAADRGCRRDHQRGGDLIDRAAPLTPCSPPARRRRVVRLPDAALRRRRLGRPARGAGAAR